METVSGITEQSSAATQEVSASAEQMSAQVEEVVASSASLQEMAQQLQSAVSYFKLNGDGGAGDIPPMAESSGAAWTMVPVENKPVTARSGNGHVKVRA